VGRQLRPRLGRAGWSWGVRDHRHHLRECDVSPPCFSARWLSVATAAACGSS